MVGLVIGVLGTVWFFSHGGQISAYGREYGPAPVASTEAPVADKSTISVTWPKW
jgi:hypothetical protein